MFGVPFLFFFFSFFLYFLVGCFLLLGSDLLDARFRRKTSELLFFFSYLCWYSTNGAMSTSYHEEEIKDWSE